MSWSLQIPQSENSKHSHAMRAMVVKKYNCKLVRVIINDHDEKKKLSRLLLISFFVLLRHTQCSNSISFTTTSPNHRLIFHSETQKKKKKWKFGTKKILRVGSGRSVFYPQSSLDMQAKNSQSANTHCVLECVLHENCEKMIENHLNGTLEQRIKNYINIHRWMNKNASENDD